MKKNLSFFLKERKECYPNRNIIEQCVEFVTSKRTFRKRTHRTTIADLQEQENLLKGPAFPLRSIFIIFRILFIPLTALDLLL